MANLGCICVHIDTQASLREGISSEMQGLSWNQFRTECDNSKEVHSINIYAAVIEPAPPRPGFHGKRMGKELVSLLVAETHRVRQKEDRHLGTPINY